jgi:PhnB protein
MQQSIHLLYDGNCEEAFRFYEQAIGAKIAFLMPYTGSPAEAEVPPEWGGKVLHATLELGNETIMGGDAPPGRYSKPQGFSVSLAMQDPAEAERIFAALVQGGKVVMPIQQTFWSPRFGMLVDRFAIPWMINCQDAA